MVSASLLGPLFLLLVNIVSASIPDGRPNANFRRPPTIPVIQTAESGPVTGRDGSELPPYNTTYLFDQLIDHNNPSLGTFKQRFWHTYEFYEPGGPIILMTPGEANAQPYTRYLTNATINGLIAQQQNGSVIILEHRFYGLSNPYPELTGKNLAVHTLQQAIDDLEYFAKNVKLPMPNGENLGPDKAPWLLTGGSYSGALTGWTMVNKPGLFWAGYASSGVVEAITDFWRYFEPIRQNMPKNCSADVEAAIVRIDAIFSGKDQNAIQKLKDNFGLGELDHLDDVAGALRNNLWDWQSLQPTSGPNTTFTRFCDALEVKDGKSAPASGWGADHAIQAWGAFWKNEYLQRLCGSNSIVDCLGSYDPNATYYTDTSIDNAGRSWFWIVCNQVGYLQDGAPNNVPTLVTRLVQPSYDLRQCQWMFPDVFSAPPDMDGGVKQTNAKYHGWNLQVDKLFFANGIRDPWREATVAAQDLHKPSTPRQILAEGDGFHCSDLSTATGQADATIGAVQKQALAAFKGWLQEWPQKKRDVKRETATGSARRVHSWDREPDVMA
ncbi:peptidase S28 [Marasmius fiardii PR-910]|nr:peptidase S28 [Marasmius fiardii PR-910]